MKKWIRAALAKRRGRQRGRQVKLWRRGARKNSINRLFIRFTSDRTHSCAPLFSFHSLSSAPCTQSLASLPSLSIGFSLAHALERTRAARAFWSYRVRGRLRGGKSVAGESNRGWSLMPVFGSTAPRTPST